MDLANRLAKLDLRESSPRGVTVPGRLSGDRPGLPRVSKKVRGL
jgi:hypothetical protein